jgi:hypothetical protein
MSNDERNVVVIGNYFIALVSLHSFDHKKLENNAVSVCVCLFSFHHYQVSTQLSLRANGFSKAYDVIIILCW